MIIETLPVGPLECNCCIVACDETKEGIILDPGGDAEKILSRVDELGIQVLYTIHTHTHIDHIAATKEVAEATDSKIVIHKGDLFLYEDLSMQIDWLASQGLPMEFFGMKSRESSPVHKFVDDEEEIVFGKQKLSVLHTPGHTPGSICLRHEAKEGHLFSGDTLFNMGIGRTDLWGGDFEQIIDSIKGRIFRLDDDTQVLPGHGPNTSVGMERRVNPFLV
jgi:glyoxylase-like metal-dependent hydrolase (beta-lactamase superfamily II)